MRRAVPVLALLLLALGLAAPGAAPRPASARRATGNNDPDASMPCAHAPYATSGRGYWCSGYDWGPIRDSARGYSEKTTFSSRGYGYRNCTDWVAWRLTELGVPASKWQGLGNGKTWTDASGRGVRVDTTPAVDAVAIETSGKYGHVAFIESISGSQITVSEYNKKEDGTYDTRTGTLQSLGFQHVAHFEAFLPVARYAGHIVQWSGDRKRQKTAWLVERTPQGLRRYWIATIAAYDCLKAKGTPGPDVLPASLLDQLADSGQQAACSTPAAPPPPVPPAPPPPQASVENVAVCPFADSYVVSADPVTGAPVHACNRDYGAGPFSAGAQVLCSADILGATGDSFNVAIQRGGTDLYPAHDEPIGDSLWHVYGDYYGPSSTVPPGAYTCLVELNGQVAASRTFTIG